MLEEQLTSGRLTFTTETAAAVPDSDVVSSASARRRLPPVRPICWLSNKRPGTSPERPRGPRRGGEVDGSCGHRGPPRTNVVQERPDLVGALDVVSNPEFLREGRALEDALHPDRILVGASSPRAFEVMRRLYRPFLDEGVRLIETDITSAELSKHASNAFLALKISYVNALARISARHPAPISKPLPA